MRRNWNKAERKDLELLAEYVDITFLQLSADSFTAQQIAKLRTQCPAVRTRAEVDFDIVRVVRNWWAASDEELLNLKLLSELCDEKTCD